MKDLPVSKKLIKYAWTREKHVIRRAELLLYADEVKRLEKRLIEAETELAWKNAHDTEEHVKDLGNRLYETQCELKGWTSTFACDSPFEVNEKHKADMAFLSYRLEKAQEMLIMMLPKEERNKCDFWVKSGKIGKTNFYRRKEQ